MSELFPRIFSSSLYVFTVVFLSDESGMRVENSALNSEARKVCEFCCLHYCAELSWNVIECLAKSAKKFTTLGKSIVQLQLIGSFNKFKISFVA